MPSHRTASQSRKERGGAEPSPCIPLYAGKGEISQKPHISLFRTVSHAHMPGPAGDEWITITMIGSHQSWLILWGLGGGVHLLCALYCCKLTQTEVLVSICWVDADNIRRDGLGEFNRMKSVS